MATFAEASKCPKCGFTGEAGPKTPTRKPGVFAVVCTCYNNGCRWFQSGWVVQINADGSVPDARERQPEDREPHMFPRVNPLLFNQRAAAMNAKAEQAFQDTKRSGSERSR